MHAALAELGRGGVREHGGQIHAGKAAVCPHAPAFCGANHRFNHAHPVAENLLDRAFEQERPNQAWAVDITYIPTDQGWLYMAGVIDLCTRKIVGWGDGRAHAEPSFAKRP